MTLTGVLRLGSSICQTFACHITVRLIGQGCVPSEWDVGRINLCAKAAIEIIDSTHPMMY